MDIQDEQIATADIPIPNGATPGAFDLRPPMLIGEGRSGTLTLRIPDPLECIPRRARRVAGRHHYHPSVSQIDEAICYDHSDWGLGTVVSHRSSPAVTFHSVASTFDFFSVKTRRTVYGTGPHELAHAKELEVDPQNIEFDLQAIRIVWNGDERQHYTADSVALTADGTVIVTEVKASDSYFEHHSYKQVMWNAERSFRAAGLYFRKVTGDEMADRRRRRWNVDRAFDDRGTAFSQHQVDALTNLLGIERGSAPMGRVTEVLSDHRSVGRQVANAMLCHRHLAYDLNGIVTDETEVTPSPDASILTDIRQIGL